MYCDNLEKVTIGKNVKHIGISAFEGSQENTYTGKSKLKTVVFNGAPKTISEKAFYFCSALTEIVLPEGVETIGEWAFAKCFSAKRIIIPEGVKKSMTTHSSNAPALLRYRCPARSNAST